MTTSTSKATARKSAAKKKTAPKPKVVAKPIKAISKPPLGPPPPALVDPPVPGLDLEMWRSGPLPIPERDPTPLPTGDFVIDGYTVAFGDDDNVVIKDAKGKLLKSVPTKIRATDDYQALMRGRKDDRSRGKRARRVIEDRMISGAPFAADEARWLVQDEAFADLFKGLVIEPANGEPVLLVGWDDARGLGVLPPDYDARWIGWHEVLVPHPMKLAGTPGAIALWQDMLVDLGMQQTLVQVFREIKSVPVAQRTLFECTMLANRETRSAAAVERVLMDDGWVTRRGHAKRTLSLRKEGGTTSVEAWFDYGEYYMPSDETTTGAFGVNDEKGRPLRMSDVAAVLLGEIIRSLEVGLAAAGAKKDDDGEESENEDGEGGDGEATDSED